MENQKPCAGPCRWIGFAVIVLGVVCAIVSLHGCAGPSKGQYKKLLHECRVANRERARIIREAYNCNLSDQQMGSIDFGEAGQ